jgi:hypothetical protein
MCREKDFGDGFTARAFSIILLPVNLFHSPRGGTTLAQDTG